MSTDFTPLSRRSTLRTRLSMMSTLRTMPCTAAWAVPEPMSTARHSPEVTLAKVSREPIARAEGREGRKGRRMVVPFGRSARERRRVG